MASSHLIVFLSTRLAAVGFDDAAFHYPNLRTDVSKPIDILDFSG